MVSAWLQGFGLGGGLIVAIGGQNAHVLRMGLQKQHVTLTVLVCIVGDVLLIAAGAAGMGALIADFPLLTRVARWAGAAFLTWYGIRAWRAAFGSDALNAEAARPALTWQQALLTVAALTWLNPHVYLDTVVLLGSVAAQQSGSARPWFALGAMSASVLWFSGIGFGARLLAPLFASPKAWSVLDMVIGVIMFALAATLVC
ncbi:Arginine exporter protein ArgO [Amantichitinum ursilacus]|uniref:Arginine exporter protein ArgO n=2 Tax=Amantichitinum ursilacus TaxID=857265 RepID=A0A0N0XHM1_9NEIS|nr:Arginine exporter protein ArgO [Amantichitinum ursilacus]